MNMSGTTFAALADILGLSLFAGLRESLFLGSFKNLIESISEEKTPDAAFFPQSNATLDLVEKWAAFMEAFVEDQKGYSFYLTLASMTALDENAYTLAAEAPDRPLPPVLQAAAKTDLSRLGRIAAFDIPGLGFYIAETCRKAGLDMLAGNIEEESRVLWAAEGKKAGADFAGELLALFPENTNWGAALPAFTERIRKQGAGIMGLSNSFRWGWVDADLALSPLTPVKSPDPIRLDDLAGYDEQRGLVIANTRRFLEGKPANHLLLYGDSGTGKSATIKAVCNEYGAQGLRLVEVYKADLGQLPMIIDFLAVRSRRFVIFIDDLSFDEPLDDSFTGLSALLEGGVETRPSNVVIYATSNSRHLVKDRFADHPAGPILGENEVRDFDVMQEQLSLAGRFGFTVVFTAPDQEEYLKIAEHIARRRGLLAPLSADSATGDAAGEAIGEVAGASMEKREKFRENALRWERWFSGRSPRAAAQYVDWLAGGDDFPWE